MLKPRMTGATKEIIVTSSLKNLILCILNKFGVV